MNNLLDQLNKKVAIEKIKNESLQQQIKDLSMLQSMQDFYFDLLLNCFNCVEAEAIEELGNSYEDDLTGFIELKEECLNWARHSSSASDYIEKIEAINLPANLSSNSLEDALSFLRTDVYNAMLHLITIRRELQDESKIRTIDSLL